MPTCPSPRRRRKDGELATLRAELAAVTLRPARCTVHRAPCTLYPAPYTLHPIPWQVHAARLEDAGALSAAVQQQQLQANASAPPAPPAPPPHRLCTAPSPLPRYHPPLGRRPSPRPARSSCSSSSGYRPCGSRGWRSGRRRRRRRRRRRLDRMAGMARVGWLGWRRVARVCRAYPRRVHSRARAYAQAKAEAAQLTEEGARQAAALCAAEAHAAELQAALGPLHLLHLCTLRTLSAPPPHPSAPRRTPCRRHWTARRSVRRRRVPRRTSWSGRCRGSLRLS